MIHARTSRLNSLLLSALFAGVLLASAGREAAAAGVVDTSGPAQLIQTASDAMLKDLEANRAKYKKDKAGLYKVVDEILLPNFDIDYAGQQVLGKNWREATPDQRTRFIKGFYRSLLQTYGDALVDFTSDRMKVLPYTPGSNPDRATVRTQIRRDGGAQVSVNYSLRKGAAGWKVWDVVIEGISYVKSFQEDFGAEVNANGLDALIKRLESPNATAK
ncbi:MAG: ABC transporter substrate-binding protein [Pseudomonadota bacterium]